MPHRVPVGLSPFIREFHGAVRFAFHHSVCRQLPQQFICDEVLWRCRFAKPNHRIAQSGRQMNRIPLKRKTPVLCGHRRFGAFIAASILTFRQFRKAIRAGQKTSIAGKSMEWLKRDTDQAAAQLFDGISAKQGRCHPSCYGLLTRKARLKAKRTDSEEGPGEAATAVWDATATQCEPGKRHSASHYP